MSISPEHHLEGAGASKGGAAKPSQAKPTTPPHPTASCQDEHPAGASPGKARMHGVKMYHAVPRPGVPRVVLQLRSRHADSCLVTGLRACCCKQSGTACVRYVQLPDCCIGCNLLLLLLLLLQGCRSIASASTGVPPSPASMSRQVLPTVLRCAPRAAGAYNR